jgi:hydrogenase nickel incorporation protein HypB
MCLTCGCTGTEKDFGLAHGHEHTQEHVHAHDDERITRRISLEKDLLERNDRLAEKNRSLFGKKGIVCLNLLSSPGSGKTTLLVDTIRRMQGRNPIYVVEGDQESRLDADRILEAGAPVLQINTGAGCHLDAHMLSHAVESLSPRDRSLLFVENVGNLVCPALFDLGETARVVVLSVTEGEEKPLKYPNMFRKADLILMNKVDLLPHLHFNTGAFLKHAETLRPGVTVLPISAQTGQGMESWIEWIDAKVHGSLTAGSRSG